MLLQDIKSGTLGASLSFNLHLHTCIIYCTPAFHEIQPRLKVCPCNCKHLFWKICSGSQVEISACLTRLNFSPGWHLRCNQLLRGADHRQMWAILFTHYFFHLHPCAFDCQALGKRSRKLSQVHLRLRLATTWCTCDNLPWFAITLIKL